jgi:hypothetical protein
VIGGLVTFAALLLPGMRAIEGVAEREAPDDGGVADARHVEREPLPAAA